MTQPRYLAERLTPDFGFYLREGELLARVQSQWQHIEVFDNALFGRVMRIDGCFMTSEREEFVYHENLIHPATVSHAEPRTALIMLTDRCMVARKSACGYSRRPVAPSVRPSTQSGTRKCGRNMGFTLISGDSPLICPS